jgi:class 3 adenylate cyclase
MALFGAPIAHEDHAVRACYAGLAIQRAMQAQAAELRSAHGIEVSVRVGLNSGEILVRTIGNDLSEGYGHVPLFTATQEFCDVLRRFVRTSAAAPPR